MKGEYKQDLLQPGHSYLSIYENNLEKGIITKQFKLKKELFGCVKKTAKKLRAESSQNTIGGYFWHV
jgi:hypothetical protein